MPQLISQATANPATQAQLAEMGAANQQLQNALVAAQNQPVAEVTETEAIVPSYPGHCTAYCILQDWLCRSFSA